MTAWRCTSYINESQIESIGHQYLNERLTIDGAYCTIKSDAGNNASSIPIIETLRSSDIVVIGDSHAHRVFYSINYAIQGFFRFRTVNLFGETACSVLFEFDNDQRCNNVRKYIRIMMESVRPDYLFIGQFMELYIRYSGFMKRVCIHSCLILFVKYTIKYN